MQDDNSVQARRARPDARAFSLVKKSLEFSECDALCVCN